MWCLIYEQYEMKYLITPQFNVLYCHSNRVESDPCFTHKKSREKVGQVMSSSLCCSSVFQFGRDCGGRVPAVADSGAQDQPVGQSQLCSTELPHPPPPTRHTMSVGARDLAFSYQ